MREYQKIETVFERDIDGSKKLIEGKFRNPIVEYLKDNKWIFTEKIDGTNIRVVWNGHNFEFYGRTDNASIPAFLVNKLQSIFCNDEMEQMFEQLFNDKQVMVCGEGYGNRIQKVGKDYIEKDVDFIVFDIIIDNFYLSFEQVTGLCSSLGLKKVPIIFEGTIQQAINYVKNKPQSTMGNCQMEGLVGQPLIPIYNKFGDRTIIKVKVKDFKEEKTND